jgi:ornithine decarboxylase
MLIEKSISILKMAKVGGRHALTKDRTLPEAMRHPLSPQPQDTVAESGSIIARVEGRKNNCLYLNDGRYGSLFDIADSNFLFPVRLIRKQGNHPLEQAPFCFFGPTCDSIDFMEGPFLLPIDTQEGDYIEIGQLGVYGTTMTTRFNGFGMVGGPFLVEDKPILSLYEDGLLSQRGTTSDDIRLKNDARVG